MLIRSVSGHSIDLVMMGTCRMACPAEEDYYNDPLLPPETKALTEGGPLMAAASQQPLSPSTYRSPTSNQLVHVLTYSYGLAYTFLLLCVQM
jgi:hypothetical protein